MQHIDDHNDDLLRKASELYPLKTEGADWDKVMQALQNSDVPMPVSTDDNQKRKRRALWLLMLLPLALLYMMLHDNAKTKKKQPVSELRTEQNGAKQNSGVTNNDKQLETAGQIANNSAGNENDNGSNHKNGNDNANNKNDNLVNSNNDSQQDLPNNAARRKQVAIIGKKKTVQSAADEKLDSNNNEQNSSADKKETNKSRITENQKSEKASKSDETALQTDKLTVTKNNKTITSDSVNGKKASNDTAAAIKDTKEVAAKQTAETNKKNKKPIIHNKKQKGIYAGLMADFDISSVKFERVNRTGYGFNLLVGYRFSRHLSIESGLVWDKKKYYSDGKYFDKTRTGIGNDYHVLYTNGSCSMFEIPVAVKYDFAMQQKSSVFATTGLSSYLMKKEDYTYRVDHNGRYYNSAKSYNNSGNNWLSVANFSIGYQRYLNKNITLRIEPYVKFPLKGIGIANMPIMSTGISAGFTRSF